ncbi:MAG: hypothetical protein ACTHKS_03475 [Gaiellaceae bacterium]
MRLRLGLAVVVLALGVLAAASAVALGAPTNSKNAFPITIYCPSGTYAAVVNGRGAFTAAHAVNSNTVLIPIAFGEFIGTINNVVVEDDPASAKGNAVPSNGRVEECYYTAQFETPDGLFVGSGTVTGFAAHL